MIAGAGVQSSPHRAPTSYYVPHEVTSPKFARAFADGCGGALTNCLDRLQPGPFAAFCTPAVWPLLAQAQQTERTWYYGDHGYWGRGKFYRVTKNAVQFQPTADHLRAARRWRFAAFGHNVAQDWRRTGTHIVICPNSDVYMRQYCGYGAEEWTAVTSMTLRYYTDRPFVVRSKQTARRRHILNDLADAHAVVVFSSNAAIDAIVAGVPVFVLAPWASAAQMGCGDLTQIDTPSYPADRLPFLYALAEHQWTLAEIASGYAWRRLQCQ